MKLKGVVILLSCLAGGLAIASLGGLLFAGYRYSWGPLSSLGDIRQRNMEGNAEIYSLSNVEKLEDTKGLEGKKIGYLGSSVTYGAMSLRTSFVEYIAKRCGTDYVKEAVSGTTLANDKRNSYVSRLGNFDPNDHFDLFLVQLSTNDASQNKPLGEYGTDDTHTVIGAICYIIDYVREAYGCPVAFYSNAYYESDKYAAMVETMKDISAKKSVAFIDMYSDTRFNDISEEQRDLYMADAIHPTMAGYLEWWTPYIEDGLAIALQGNE